MLALSNLEYMTLQETIEDYKRQSEAFENMVEDDEDAIESTFGPSLDALRNWREPARNIHEARAALDLAEWFKGQWDGEPAVHSLERAAMEYVKSIE